ncbi:hypothetical protein [Acaryochloris marina]|uniref:hypothetical protein n=1 Tax=Acaryochloris marina TaxID=155978 RepID=UPI001BAF00B8|nr:hypothetical protein [Acaryochloris marina]QUY46199.1 hypothetical protein I1H34_31245 [Acaryochloris marina S15]
MGDRLLGNVGGKTLPIFGAARLIEIQQIIICITRKMIHFRLDAEILSRNDVEKSAVCWWFCLPDLEALQIIELTCL